MIIKARLRNGIDEVTIKEAEGKRTYANPAGHGFEQEFQEINLKLDALSEDSAKLQQSIASLMAMNTEQKSVNDSLKVKNTVQESTNDSLSTRVTQLQKFTNGFKEVRQRMFTVYKRDIKGQTYLGRSRSIAVGNAHAHDADALTDARLFDDDPFWQDRSTYLEIYGLQFEEVLAYCMYTDHTMGQRLIKMAGNKFNDDSRVLFQILNARSNMLLDGKTLGRPLDTAFRSFLQAVQHLSLEDSPTSLESHWTYGAFWQAYRKN